MGFFIRLAFVLILMAGSVILAPSEGQMAGMTQITICAEDGTEIITLDAQGNPVAPHHPCPDCLPGFATAQLSVEVIALRTALPRPLSLPLPRREAGDGIIPIRASARAPPWLV
jgi:hypothetical protein